MGSIAKSVFLFVAFFVCAAEAYIPHSQTITSRLIRTHGKGAYAIEQDVQFRIGAENIVLRESWIVTDSEAMKLTVSPAPGSKIEGNIHFESLYQSGKRVLTDPSSGNVTTAALSLEFIEPVFHSRTSRSFLGSLARSKVVPASFLNERPRPQRIDQVRHTPEPHVRLGRTSGAMAWVFGEPTPANGPLNPSVWIEQDMFVVRRLRFPSEAELLADKYANYARELKLPRERTLNWQNHSVNIRLISVRPLSAAQASKALGSAAALRPGRLPEHAQIREFYTRFR